MDLYYARRTSEDKTKITTNKKSVIEVLDTCEFSQKVKTSFLGTTYVLNKDMDKLPDIYENPELLKQEHATPDQE